MNKYIKKLKLNTIFKEEESRFLLICGLKFSAIFVLSAFFVYYSMWIIVTLNSIYFESSTPTFSQDMRDLFFYNAFSFLFSFAPEVFAFFLFLFFAGGYIGKVLLRPFEVIGNYCQQKVENDKAEYAPDLFSDYKLLSRFSEHFFIFIEKCLKEKKLTIETIPEQFSRIHGPSFEKVFFFHFSLIVFILATIVGFFVAYLAIDVHEQIISLSFNSVSTVNSKELSYFLENQTQIYSQVVIATSLIIFVGYLLLSFHLYSKISGAIFGFFATMRSFMKGNYKARVHLIGYAHIRPYGRYMNKFLDHVERQCLIDNNNNE